MVVGRALFQANQLNRKPMKTNNSIPGTAISTIKANQVNFTVLTTEQMDWIKGGGIVPHEPIQGIAAIKAH